MRHHFLACIAVLAWTASAGAQQVTEENVDGIRNFVRLETTVACSGAVAADSVPEIKKFGFVSIINLREATEPALRSKGRSGGEIGRSALLPCPVQRHQARSRRLPISS